MRIAIAGGSGFLGAALAARLRAAGHQVSILTRTYRRPGDVLWDPMIPSGAWVYCVERSEAVINLAGESIAGRRWTRARKAALLRSRVDATHALAEVILNAEDGPRILVSGSGVGVYGARGEETLTEDSTPGDDFLAGACKQWEAEARRAEPKARVVLLRTGLVLDRAGGALPQMAMPFRFGVGGIVGSGEQYISWICRDDWTAMVEWALGTETAKGPLNVTAPGPVTNREFSKTLAHLLRRPSVVPAPAFALRLLLGEMADALLLTGQRVVPAKAQSLGFAFQYPDLEPALRAIYTRR